MDVLGAMALVGGAFIALYGWVSDELALADVTMLRRATSEISCCEESNRCCMFIPRARTCSSLTR